MSEVKTIPLRLDRELYTALAQYALAHDKSRTAVIREALAAKLTVGNVAAINGGNEDGEGKKQPGKIKRAPKRLSKG